MRVAKGVVPSSDGPPEQAHQSLPPRMADWMAMTSLADLGISSFNRGNSSGRSTRELLVRTAEQLFAERGIHGVSLREIGITAGQRNNAVAQYHFGTRQNLLVAIYVHRAISLNERRLELLAELRADDRLSNVPALLRAILLPHLESIMDPDNNFLGYLARLLTEEASFDVGGGEDVARHLGALIELEGLLRLQMPQLTNAQFEWRYSMVFNWAIHALAEYERSHPRRNQRTCNRMFEDLLVMLTAALCADMGMRRVDGHAGPSR
jgi:AcrR family transcriptional regulator